MEIVKILSWIAAAAGVSGSLLLATHRPYSYLGWGLFLIASALWIGVATYNQMWPLVASSCAYLIIESYGLYKAMRKEKGNG